MNNWQSWIGRTLNAEDVLTPGLLTRFRATIDSGTDGTTAPQGLHWCLCVPDVPTAMLGSDGHPQRSDAPHSFLPPIPLPRRMWASSSVRFLTPIALGDHIARTSVVASVKEKSGSTGPLVFVEIDHVTRANGKPAVEERQTLVYREASATPSLPAPDEAAVDFSEWGWSRSLRPDAPLLFRYSALTFNSHRIHYDRPYAVDEECYRGLVVHGPLTATLLLDLAARELGHNSLTQFTFRGVSPAIEGEALHLVAKREGQKLLLAALGGDGRLVTSAEGLL